MPDLNFPLAQWLFGIAHHHPLLDAAIVFFARHLPYLLVLCFIGCVLAERGRRQRLFLLLQALLTLIISRGVITEGIRFFYHAPRPFEAWQAAPLVSETIGNSFPSGHAAFLFALGAVLFFRNRKWGMWFTLFALVNGIARIASGVHWPTDIVGGAVIGIGSAFLVHLFLKRPLHTLDIAVTKPRAVQEAVAPEEQEGGAA